ncbi:MAG: glycosyltransferase family 4 protein [Candidatus Omnitrophica bacterium]|nr:glycosyltransferase family 4 protein [Candidatus Omnitrophota bacterium]
MKNTKDPLKILYLTYGRVSGVCRSLGDALSHRGQDVRIVDVGNEINYRTKKYLHLFKHRNLWNACLAIAQFGYDWRRHYKKTSFAFQQMSRAAEKVLQENSGDYDIILQSGTLFSPGTDFKKRKYFLYLDHTYAISRGYDRSEGLRVPLSLPSGWQEMEKEVYENAKKIFAYSVHVKNSLINDYGIKEDSVVVAGAGSNIEVSSLEDKRYDGKTVLFVGLDFQRKGGPVLLKAFEIVKKEIPECRLYIVGSNLRVRQEGVIVKGVVTPSELAPLYESSTLFVLPTIREPFGLVFLEAMAHGLPCIGTDIEAVPEIIEDGITGFIVPAEGHLALARRMISLLRDRPLMEKMGRAGYRKVSTLYNWDKVAERMLREFQDSAHRPDRRQAES